MPAPIILFFIGAAFLAGLATMWAFAELRRLRDARDLLAWGDRMASERNRRLESEREP